MDIDQFVPTSYQNKPTSGEVTWQSPSNIALVKYWGKYGEQLPKNPSVSFTLNNCNTTTRLSFELADSPQEKASFEVFLNREPAPNFREKIAQFFQRVEMYLPFVRAYTYKIETSNSFPHSSGIASSASGMSALALCLMSIEKQLQPEMSDSYFNQKASFLARLGSGSASRSIEGPLVVWGAHDEIDGSSQLFGTCYPYEVHPVFRNYQDTILLVDKGEKQVSSTVGHNLMKNHKYAESRFAQAHEHLKDLKGIFKSGNLEGFIEMVESEALTLHAMMMTSRPYFMLMKPNTLKIINKIWEYRAMQQSNLCFTLDAGANVHVLYPADEKEAVLEFITNKLAPYCKNGEFIKDHTGEGAIQL